MFQLSDAQDFVAFSQDFEQFSVFVEDMAAEQAEQAEHVEADLFDMLKSEAESA